MLAFQEFDSDGPVAFKEDAGSEGTQLDGQIWVRFARSQQEFARTISLSIANSQRSERQTFTTIEIVPRVIRVELCREAEYGISQAGFERKALRC